MGAILSRDDKVMPHEFGELSRSSSEASDNFRDKSRKTTDVCFLIFMSIFLTVLLAFVGYCVFYGDIYRIINGYDNCGNVCDREKHILKHGEKRKDECSDATGPTGKYHIVIRGNDSHLNRFCVSNCSSYDGYKKFFNRCIQEQKQKVVNNVFSKSGIQNFFQEVAEDFHFCWKEFVCLCLISLGFSLLLLILFRYLVGLVVWIVLIGAVLASCTGSVILWIMWNQSKSNNVPDKMISDIDSRKTGTYLAFAITATIVTVIITLIIIVMRKRIQLVVRLFEEAGKAVAAMPVLLLEPILTFLCLAVVIFLWFYFCLWIESSGILTEKRPHVYRYEKDGWMKFTRWYNILAMFWMVQFIIGCQHMVIAGAVSSWFFTRDKKRLGTPIIESAYNLSRYHLGSVALGSFLIAMVQFARLILKLTEKYLKSHQGNCVNCALKCCQCCLYCFEKILKYLSRNAYIEVAICGYSFCRGGRQAFKLLSANVLRVATINSVGDFILFLGKIVVVIATVLIGIKIFQHKDGLQHIWVPVTLAGLFAYFVAHCFMTVYEMVIDTIFLCFCEDCEQNDGISKPYYMSRGLMEFVENSKKALEILDSKSKRGGAWQNNVSTISNNVN